MEFQFERVWIFWLSLVLIPLIWLWFRDRHSRIRRTPYLELWEEAASQARLWERFLAYLPNVKWWVSILAFFFINLAAAGLSRKEPGGGTYHLVIDRSASMAARLSSGQTRLEKSVSQVQEFLKHRLLKDRVSLSVLDSQFTVLIPLTDRIESLMEPLQALHTENKASNFKSLKQKLGESKQWVLLYSDGVGESKEELENWPELISLNVDPPCENAGFLEISVRDPWPKKKIMLECAARNFSKKSISRELRCSLNGKALQSIPLNFAPDETISKEIEIERSEGGLLELRLFPEDCYAVDDVIHAKVIAPPKAPILLLQSGEKVSPFLNAAAQALAEEEGENFQVVQNLEGQGADGIILAEGGSFKELPESGGRYFLFGSQVENFCGEPVRKTPTVLDWSKDHSLTQGLQFDLLRFRRALSLQAPAKALLWAADGALIYTADWGKSRIVGTTFQLSDSNFAVQPSFPVLLRRGYAWLLGQEHSAPASLSAGKKVYLSPKDPDWLVPATVGRVQTPVGESYVNFFEPNESNLQSGWEFQSSKPIPVGPGVFQSLVHTCLWAALGLIALKLLLDWLIPN